MEDEGFKRMRGAGARWHEYPLRQMLSVEKAYCMSVAGSTNCLEGALPNSAC
jgi:hypothetical protein